MQDALADPKGRKVGSLPAPEEGGRERKEKRRERDEGSSLYVLASILTCKNVFSSIKHSTNESSFPFITSETIIIIVL